MTDYVITANIGGQRVFWGERDSKRASLWYSFPTAAHTNSNYHMLLTIARTRLPADVNYVNHNLATKIPIDLRVEEAPV